MPALAHIQHHIGDPLAGAVIGVLAAALAFVDGKPVRLGQISGFGAGACGIKWRVLDKPYRLVGLTPRNRIGARFHEGHGLVIVGQPV